MQRTMNINLPASAHLVKLSEVQRQKDARIRVEDRCNNFSGSCSLS